MRNAICLGLVAVLAIALRSAAGAGEPPPAGTGAGALEERVERLEKGMKALEGVDRRLAALEKAARELDAKVAVLNAKLAESAAAAVPDASDRLSARPGETTPMFSDNWEMESLKNDVRALQTAVESLNFRLDTDRIR